MKELNNLTVTVFGGTGFVGRHLVRHLCIEDCRVQIPTRNVSKSYFLQPLGDVGQIIPIKCDFSKNNELQQIIENSDIVINLIGILYEKKKKDFENVHYGIVKKIVDIYRFSKNKKLIHLSAIGAEKNTQSLYGQSKYKAEQYILKNSNNSFVVKPSIIFGPEDNFFNLFAKISFFSPFLPLIMGGKTKFQPVYVDDVCKGIIKILKKGSLKDRIFEFGGPDIYSFKELMQILLKTINRKRFLLYIPKTIAFILSKFLELLPSPILTTDQLKLLSKDNIVSKRFSTFKDLKVSPVSLELVISDYLKRFIKNKYFF